MKKEKRKSLYYSFTEPLDRQGKWQTSYGDAGEYIITVTATDGELSTSEKVKLVVKKKEEGLRKNLFTYVVLLVMMGAIIYSFFYYDLIEYAKNFVIM